MTLKSGNGKMGWIIAGLSTAGLIITVIAFTSTLQSRMAKVEEHDRALIESKADRVAIHIDISTLKECARNTENKLGSIESKLDQLLMSKKEK
jgi:uncharacterized protein YqgV (UPF0045/DUF77 family)